MIEIIALFFISGVCAPFDWSDCNYNIHVFDDYHTTMAKHDDRTLYFWGDWHNQDDRCFDMTYWQHEWLHVEIGSFHMERGPIPGLSCEIRPGFEYRVENSVMFNIYKIGG